ncbi:MAG: methyltransferase [Deltaproteobacteria bacterium]|nr:methyltransferase [Deltaproteobacteria bacterium]
MMGQLDLIPGLVPALDSSMGQWWTPPRLAERIAREFPIEGHVLEPTAGAGNLAVALAKQAEFSLLEVNEIDPRWTPSLRHRLRAERELGSVKVHETDWLETSWDDRRWFDWCVMNPPDESKRGVHVVDFLERALLGADHTVALIRLNALTTGERTRRVWKRAHVRQLVMLASRPAFGPSGGEQEWCVVWFGPEAGPVHPTVWWEDGWS